MTRVQINFNQLVRVKLTEVGIQRHREIEGRLRNLPSNFDLSYIPAVNENGYYHTRLWELMRDYGDLLNHSGYPPFEMEAILFE